MTLRRIGLAVIATTMTIGTTAGPVWAHHEEERTPGSTAPDTTVPGSAAPDTTAPDTGTPETTVPDTTVPDTTAPDTGTPGTSPDTSSPDTSTPAPADEAGSQSIEITSVQVAVAETGGNTVDAGDAAGAAESGADGASGSTAVTSGAATATGAADSTTITQEATVTLDDTSTAEVVQIAIVFNIGGAIAGTGTNAVTGTGASGVAAPGDITTGSATAVGLDADVDVTQAATGEAGAGGSDSSHQHSVTMQIGIATSSTGANTIVATLSSAGGGVISTGDATATGSMASTGIEQLATLVGVAGADLTVEQRATVVNLGAALADTGSNSIGTAFAAAITAGDSGALESLLSLLVPALSGGVPSGASGPGGSGSIVTGDATAIGNRSTTEIDQIAVATGDGGTVEIGQDVVVINAGLAAAITGGNSIGAGGPAVVTPETAEVARQLAAFVDAVMADIDAWAAGGEVDLDTARLSTALGPLAIDLDGTFEASTAGGDASATIRQLSAVINLAFALANTGDNTAVGTAAGDAADGPSAAPPVVIVTGDADATNRSVVIVCQLDDTERSCREEVAPASVAVAAVRAADPAGRHPIVIVLPAVTTAAEPSAPAELPITGAAAVETMGGVAAVLVLTGGMLVLGTRRRRLP